jgi:hypothetical protein
MIDLTYDCVEQAMKDAVPEVQDKYSELLSWHTDPPGIYTLFAFVLEPVLLSALSSGSDPALLKRIFNFFEAMARSSDVHVRNLLQVEILEQLVGDKTKLSVAWSHMGQATRKITQETARIRRSEQNLPEEE